ncbi:MAG: transcriptional regulator [Rhodospirillales bacterium 69-11]|nr:helix-turn-helix transcriptional regulator [Rhodospirillales bacterium]OJW21875.1 MAG: transcriptional regulator [Rhodospirillales bacterium 69-11]
MRFTEIGQQLRAYRLESGLRAEEIAARLGVSRAALYRYEKGEVIKLDTIKRLAELLKISPLSLLGIGVEYYNRPIGYFERVRQIEETADQILQMFGAISYLTTSDAYDAALAEAFDEAADQAGGERLAMRSMAEQVLGILTARKRMYASRRPGIICMVSISSVQRLLETGIADGIAVSERVRRICRDVAVTEIENMATLMEAEPMGLQFGLLTNAEPSSAFKILRARDRVSLAINPFRPDTHPSAQTGVAMITGADEAIAAHQRVAEASWREAIKGPAGAARLRQLVNMAVPAL